MPKETGRTPDYALKAVDTRNKWVKVGAAWVNDDESISISIDYFVVLDGRDQELKIVMFPWETKDA